MSYIDKKMAIAGLSVFVNGIHGRNIHFSEGINTAVDVIANLPNADVVPVVRCKDCIYRRRAKINEKGFLICPASGMEIKDDDFCSYGAKVDMVI